MRPVLTALTALCLTLAFLIAATPAAQARCVGQNLLNALSVADRTALDAALKDQPYPSGNHWRATRGSATIHLIGTFHLFDPRMEDAINHLTPFIQHADAVYLEATEVELKKLQTEVARRPELLFIGPKDQTLPERLTAPEWTALQAELTARGIPPFIASKFQPWYITVMLGVPVCAMKDLTAMPQGLDTLIMKVADGAHVPTLALEPFDTLFTVFNMLRSQDQTDLLRATLAMSAQAEDMFTTMTEAYFAQDTLRLWEFSRLAAVRAPGMTPEAAAEDFAVLEDALLTRRNRAWMDVIIPASQDRTIIVAVGAAHLSGRNGLLNLLEQAGYTLKREPF